MGLEAFLYEMLWFWVLVAVFGLPFLAVRFTQFQSTRRFVIARRTELSNPIDASARYQLASLYIKQRRFANALPLLEEAYKIQQERPPCNPRLLDDLARLYVRKRRTEDALPLLKQSLQLDPQGNQGETFLLLGKAFLQKGELERARECFLQTQQANTSLAEPVFRVACVDLVQSKSDDALRRLKEFLKDASHLPPFLRRRNRWWVFAMRLFPLSARFFTP
ncbi:MAG: tetratricopeptide repeat protein [Myxococcales bacterium]|nr:tetratricopeptide repeat protein [Myxococcales bacterium]